MGASGLGRTEAAAVLVAMLERETGLILGDLAEALGRLGEEAARGRLEELQRHPLDWVRNKARWALGRLGAVGNGGI